MELAIGGNMETTKQENKLVEWKVLADTLGI